MEHIKEQLEAILGSIAQTAKNAGRNPEDVKLVAVSKNFPREAAAVAYEAGQRTFGENRVQELEAKAPALPNDIEWHLIGHLQGNKALKAVNMAAYIHSVDSIRLLNRIDRLAGENSKRPKILLELNVSKEASKFGLTEEKAAMELAEAAVKCQSLDFAGLMTMAPFGAEDDALKSVFSGLPHTMVQNHASEFSNTRCGVNNL